MKTLSFTCQANNMFQKVLIYIANLYLYLATRMTTKWNQKNILTFDIGLLQIKAVHFATSALNIYFTIFMNYLKKHVCLFVTLKGNGSSVRGLTGSEVVLLAGLISALCRKNKVNWKDTLFSHFYYS